MWLFVVSAALIHFHSNLKVAPQLNSTRGFGRRTFSGLDTTDGLSSCERGKGRKLPPFLQAAAVLFLEGVVHEFDFSLSLVFPSPDIWNPCVRVLCPGVIYRRFLLRGSGYSRRATNYQGEMKLRKSRVSFVVCADCK